MATDGELRKKGMTPKKTKAKINATGILIAVERQHISDTLKRYLKRLGYRVRSASEDDNIVKEVLAFKPQVALIDISLPGKSGFRICHEIKQSAMGDKCSVILLSGVYQNIDNLREKLKKVGADDFISKPFTLFEIKERIQKTLENLQSAITGKSPEQKSTTKKIKKTKKAKKFALQGNLEELPFPNLLYQIFYNQFSGQLRFLSNGKITFEIYFLKGCPVFSRSISTRQALGKMLLDRELITMDQLGRALKAQKKLRLSLGSMLIKGRYIGKSELLEVLDQQVKERVLSCFFLTRGHYYFTEGDDFVGEITEFEQNPVELIVEGIKRTVPFNDLATELAPKMGLYPIKTTNFARFAPPYPFSEETKTLMKYVNGTLSLNQLMQKKAIDLEEFLFLIKTLTLMKMLSLKSKAISPKPDLAPESSVTDDDELVNMSSTLGPFHEQSQPESFDSREIKTLKQEILDVYLNLGRLSFYELLEVDSDAPTREIREAYKKIIEKFQPKYTVGLEGQFREKAMQVYESLTRAKDKLTDPEARMEYDLRLHSRNSASEFPSDRELAQSSLNMERGWGALKQGDAPKAVNKFTQEVKHNPENPDALAYLGWAKFNLPGDLTKRFNEARQHLMLAISINPGSVQAYFFLGKILTTSGYRNEAINNFKTVLRLQPNHSDARKELKKLIKKI